MKSFRFTTEPIIIEGVDEVDVIEKWLEMQKIIGLTHIQEYQGPNPITDKKNIRFPLLNTQYAEKRHIITLCGSTRFYKLFDEINYRLTLKGFMVLSIGCHSKSDYCLGLNEIQSAKMELDILHKDKIRMSESIFVIDKDSYIGESTRSEIDFATKLKRKIYYYSKGDLEKFLNA